jgi:C4-dicarboxylate transporter DctM subunit
VIAALFILLALRVPIGVSLGGVSVVGIYLLKGSSAAFGAAITMPHDFYAKWELSAIPMFLLMGAVAFHSGMTAGLFSCARLWLSRLPGGLAVATNFAAALFSAVSGSSVATAAAMGRIAVPEMLRYKYQPGLATAVAAASGTIGSLIPPGILFVLYGMFTGQPIGQLLMAGVLPGLLTVFVYSAMIVVRCKLNPSLAPPVLDRVTWTERFVSLRAIWPLPLLIFAVMGVLYAGWATATEAAALGALISFLIAGVQRKLTGKAMLDSIMETLKGTAMIFFIGVGAILFTRFLAFAGVPQYMSSLASVFADNPFLLLVVVSVVYLVLGMFLDGLGLLMLTLPVFLPFFQAAGLDLIWMGVIIVKFVEISLITPPVGLNAFVIKSVVGNGISLGTIFKALNWFMAAEILIMGLLFAFPEISLFIPRLMAE